MRSLATPSSRRGSSRGRTTTFIIQVPEPPPSDDSCPFLCAAQLLCSGRRLLQKTYGIFMNFSLKFVKSQAHATVGGLRRRLGGKDPRGESSRNSGRERPEKSELLGRGAGRCG